jgi:hypothetical protein
MNNIVNFFNYSYNDDGTFDLKFTPISRPLLSFKEEVGETAKKIGQSTDNPIVLCMSGGIDGEIVARAFIENKIEFTVLSLRHIDGANDHDITFAIDFCKTNNITQKIVEFDFKNFIITKIPDYIDQGYVTWRAFRCQQLYLFELVEEMGATAVLGGGPSPFFTIDDEICLNFKSDEFMCLEWLRKNNKTHFPYFFWHNPEIMASYFKEDLINFMLSDPSYFVNVWLNTSYEKMTVYHKYWTDMPRRRKFDGFENIRGTDWARINIDPLRKSVGELKEKYIPISTIRSQLGI